MGGVGFQTFLPINRKNDSSHWPTLAAAVFIFSALKFVSNQCISTILAEPYIKYTSNHSSIKFQGYPTPTIPKSYFPKRLHSKRCVCVVILDIFNKKMIKVKY